MPNNDVVALTAKNSQPASNSSKMSNDEDRSSHDSDDTIYDKNANSQKRRHFSKSPSENYHIHSMLHMKVDPPFNISSDTLKWLDEDCRHGCWNCRELDHQYVDCIHPKLRIFCFGCGMIDCKMNDCPNCKEEHKRKYQ